MAGQAHGPPLRVARSRQRWLQRGQIYLKFRPLRGLPKVHEAYFMDLRFTCEAQKAFLRFIIPSNMQLIEKLD
jgi:hypothetical protein